MDASAHAKQFIDWYGDGDDSSDDDSDQNDTRSDASRGSTAVVDPRAKKDRGLFTLLLAAVEWHAGRRRGGGSSSSTTTTTTTTSTSTNGDGAGGVYPLLRALVGRVAPAELWSFLGSTFCATDDDGEDGPSVPQEGQAGPMHILVGFRWLFVRRIACLGDGATISEHSSSHAGAAGGTGAESKGNAAGTMAGSSAARGSIGATTKKGASESNTAGNISLAAGVPLRRAELMWLWEALAVRRARGMEAPLAAAALAAAMHLSQAAALFWGPFSLAAVGRPTEQKLPSPADAPLFSLRSSGAVATGPGDSGGSSSSSSSSSSSTSSELASDSGGPSSPGNIPPHMLLLAHYSFLAPLAASIPRDEAMQRLPSLVAACTCPLRLAALFTAGIEAWGGADARSHLEAQSGESRSPPPSCWSRRRSFSAAFLGALTASQVCDIVHSLPVLVRDPSMAPTSIATATTEGRGGRSNVWNGNGGGGSFVARQFRSLYEALFGETAQTRTGLDHGEEEDLEAAAALPLSLVASVCTNLTALPCWSGLAHNIGRLVEPSSVRHSRGDSGGDGGGSSGSGSGDSGCVAGGRGGDVDCGGATAAGAAAAGGTAAPAGAADFTYGVNGGGDGDIESFPYAATLLGVVDSPEEFLKSFFPASLRTTHHSIHGTIGTPRSRANGARRSASSSPAAAQYHSTSSPAAPYPTSPSVLSSTNSTPYSPCSTLSSTMPSPAAPMDHPSQHPSQHPLLPSPPSSSLVRLVLDVVREAEWAENMMGGGGGMLGADVVPSCRASSILTNAVIGLDRPDWGQGYDRCDSIEAAASTSTTTTTSSSSSSSLLNQLYGMAVPQHVKHLYSTIRGAIGNLGGAGAGGAIYGEVTMTSFHRLLLYLQSTTNLNADSIFVDIGAGLGKPNLHAAAHVKCCSVG